MPVVTGPSLEWHMQQWWWVCTVQFTAVADNQHGWWLLQFIPHLFCYVSAHIWLQTNAFLRCGPWKTGMNPCSVPGLRAEPLENGEHMALPFVNSLENSVWEHSLLLCVLVWDCFRSRHDGAVRCEALGTQSAMGERYLLNSSAVPASAGQWGRRC